MELPCVVHNICLRKSNGFALLGCLLDTNSSKYKPEMDQVVSPAINPTYNTFTVVVETLDINEKPEGGQYIFVGDFTRHKKFGYQFKATYYYQDEPSTSDGLKAFLMTIKNIKESRSQNIIEKFGVDGTIDVLNEHPDRLIEISGITERMIPQIKAEWDDRQYMRNLYDWFTEHQIDPKIAEQAFKKWRKSVLEVIQQNPYRLTEIKRIGFRTADRIAYKINSSMPSEFRITAAMEYVLSEAIGRTGHLCLPYNLDDDNNNFIRVVIKLLTECDDALGKKSNPQSYRREIAQILKTKTDTFTTIRVNDKKKKPVYVYLKEIWQKESYVAQQLLEHSLKSSQTIDCTDEDIAMAEEDVSKHNNISITLDETQKEAVKSVFQNNITIVTGGGGSGKSTICRSIYKICKEKGLSVRMMSPTGKAAQVMTEKTNCPAATIHRSLQIQKGSDVPLDSIMQDVVIIDEISMSGLDTMYAVMVALEDNKDAHIVLVGDRNQLPSVSPGNFLFDTMQSGFANVVYLDVIHRQSEESYIPIVAGRIADGQVAEIPEHAEDMTWNQLSVDDFHDNLRNFVNNYLSSGHSIDDLQIISPMKKGNCGVFAINTTMQDLMASHNNTQDNFIEVGFNKYFYGDRVIQMENDYDKNVYNGDIGTIEDLGERVIEDDRKERFIKVKFDGGQTVNYTTDDFGQIMLAWCITVHKFQGSQSPYIVLVLASEARIMMSKELVYTAITRASKHITIFGDSSMLQLAPARSAIRKRYTNMYSITRNIKQKGIIQVVENG